MSREQSAYPDTLSGISNNVMIPRRRYLEGVRSKLKVMCPIINLEEYIFEETILVPRG